MNESSKAALLGLGVIGLATVTSHFFGKPVSSFNALYVIQRKKTPYKPGPDHDPNDDLSYWDNRDGCWVDTPEEASALSSKNSMEEIIKKYRLREGNPGDDISAVEELR